MHHLKMLRYNPCVTRGSHSFTCHPHTNHFSGMLFLGPGLGLDVSLRTTQKSWPWPWIGLTPWPWHFKANSSPLFCKKWSLCVFEPHLGPRGNVRCSSQSHWKARSRLPISDNWTFFARCYGRGAMSEYRLEVAVVKGVGHFRPKYQVERDISTHHSSCQKTRFIDLSYGLWI